MPFVYDSVAQKALVDLLTTDRLTAYLAATYGDTYEALRLYEYNTRLSEALFGVIQGLEIALRNSCHITISKEKAAPNRYDIPTLLDAKEAKSVSDAKKNISKWGKVVTPGRVVSELTFGFWVRLLAPQYEKRLFVPHLYKAFPHLARPNRSHIFGRMENIRKLRNRIAHHEPIFVRNLKTEYDEIVEATGWICPTTQRWLMVTNAFVRRGFR